MIFLDTSGLFCVHHRLETQHAEAARIFLSASKVLTHNYVLAEFLPLCESRNFPRPAALNCLNVLQRNPIVDVIFVDSTLHDEAMQLLQQRLDKSWSLCDAVSFILMDDHNLREALTTDHHFEQAGFIRLLKP